MDTTNYVIKIDELVRAIKQKIDSIGMTSADMFILFTLEILRGEIRGKKGITELTIRACVEIISTTSHFYYYRDYPLLYDFLQNVFAEISKIDSRFYSADLKTIGFEVKDWLEYVCKASNDLLRELPTEYYYKDR